MAQADAVGGNLRDRIAQLVEDTLLPAGPESLRAVGATWNPRRIRLVCYLDVPITEDVRTAIHHAGSHIMEAFLGERRVCVEVQQLDRPAPIPAPDSKAAFVAYPPGEAAT